MNHETEVRKLDCARAMALVHRRLDGDTLDGRSVAWRDAHVSCCGECRDASVALAEIQRSLRALPAVPLPDEVLQRVWARTVRAHGSRGWLGWRATAAAAVVTAVLGGLWYAGRTELPSAVATRERGPTDAELARAAEEARFVLHLTSAALRRTERAAIGEVLGRRVAPALSKIPIELPGASPQDGERRPRGGDDA